VPEIRIERNHSLGLPAAREVARQLMQRVEQDFGMQCSYAEGKARDVGRFGRAGVDGRVEVSAGRFRLEATLSFPLESFSEEIERRLRQKLDAMLGADAAPDDEDPYNDKDWL
jgi:putative polyhydroxyalkanoate system protein